MGDRDVLQVPRQVYRLRVFGLALGFVCVGAVFYERHAAGAAWGLLALHAFIWPHVAWQRARRSADPHRAERQHLLVDSGFGGVVVSLMEFALLPSVLIIAMLSMDKIGWGARFLLRASLTMASGLVVSALATGARFDPGTSMAMIAASLPLMVAYPIAVASVADRSGRLARERRKAIEQTVAMREQLAHTARVGTLGEMAAGLAHELNQPLTAIHLEASTALELDTAGDRAAVRDCLARVGEQSLRAGDIVRRMRSFARRVRSSRERADVADLIREVLGLLDHELRLANVETRLEVQPPIPMVTVDRIEIQQVLVNLIRNAMEAMTQPSVSLRRLIIRAESANGAVRVSVSDTGPGIDPSILDRLFHPFQSTKPDGLGLGLSICETLIEAHGGRIGAEPAAAGNGATFFFELR
jgi:signal transduction histidine kinase